MIKRICKIDDPTSGFVPANERELNDHLELKIDGKPIFKIDESYIIGLILSAYEE